MTSTTNRIVELTPDDIKEIDGWLVDFQVHGGKANPEVQKKVFGIVKVLPNLRSGMSWVSGWNDLVLLLPKTIQ